MRQFFNRIGASVQRFMVGRYGSDKLNVVILVISVVLEILYSFTHLLVFSLLSMGLIILCFLRMFSRNIPKRYAENQKLLKLWDRVKMLKKYHLYRCGNCRQLIRVPRKGGKRVEIRCPKCGHTFIKKI